MRIKASTKYRTFEPQANSVSHPFPVILFLIYITGNTYYLLTIIIVSTKGIIKDRLNFEKYIMSYCYE